MPSRLKRPGNSRNSLLDGGGSTSDGIAGSAPVKRMKPPAHSNNDDELATFRKLRTRNSRPNIFTDGESITISSDSESSRSAPHSRQKQPDSNSVIIGKAMNSHSSSNAESQNPTTTSAVNDEIMILSSSSSSPEKNISSRTIQRQKTESPGSDNGKRKVNEDELPRTLSENERETKHTFADSSVSSDAKNVSKYESPNHSASDEEIVKNAEGMEEKSRETMDVSHNDIRCDITSNSPSEKTMTKPNLRRRKVVLAGSDYEEGKTTSDESAVVKEDGEVKVLDPGNKHKMTCDSGEENRTTPIFRRRKIVSSGSDEGTREGIGVEALIGMPSGDDGLQVEKLEKKPAGPVKYRLRRRRSSSSSSSGGTSSSSSINGRSGLLNFCVDEDNAAKTRKRSQDPIDAEEETIKDPRDEIREEADDAEDKDGKKGRKKIRKILKDKKLSFETKNAEALERERRKRLEERQKLYNSVFEDTSEGSVSKGSRLVLDFKKDSEEPLVEVNPDLVKHLKPHQVQAVRFLYDNIIESVEEHKENRSRLSGAILAHCMGLGKSLSTIAFIHTLLTHKEAGLGINSCLILCPVNTLLNWHREWRHWMPESAEINVYELATAVANNFRIDVIRHWHSEGGVLLMGYDMYRNITTSLLKKTRKQAYKKLIPTALSDPGPDIVVCDEGHLLKNCKTGVTKAINGLKTPKRVILTGTPLQNNLSEYWTMVNFVKPNLLGSAREFANRFVNPIKNGQHSNSTERDVQLMKKRAHVLFKTLDGCVQRIDYSCLTQYLPPRLEYVLKIRLSSVQCELYRAFLQQRLERGVSDSGDDQRNTLFRDQQSLYRVWTHPYTLRMHETREARRLLLEDSTSEDEEKEEDESSTSASGSDSDSGETVNSGSESVSANSDVVAAQVTATSRSTRARLRQMRNTNVVNISDSGDEANRQTTTMKEELQTKKPIGGNADDVENDLLKPWWYPFYRDEYDLRIDVGAKLSALFFILKKCSEIGDKVLVFSQSLFSLDLIEWFLAAIDRQWCMSQGLEIDKNSKQSQELDRLFQLGTFEMPSLVEYFSDMDRNTWRRGHDYERIDGSLSAVQRNSLQTRFNNPNQRFRLLIISTKAGGLGVNLTAANRLIIFDVSWNPSHDVQSIFRSYRFGQTKPVYIYRMVAQGTMEEKMYDRQVTKQSLALRVIDEQQIDRHFKEEDLRELYTFEPDKWDTGQADQRPPPVLPKDRLLADLLSDHPSLVVSYHNHDSLLENRLDEGLSEAERAEAWREYEEEKRVGRPMTEYQRLLFNNPEAAAALMAQRQRIEDEHRQRVMAMAAAYAAATAATAANRFSYASINPSPLGLVDSMYTAVPAHTLPTHRPETSLSSRPQAQQPQRDVFSESFTAMRNMLLTRYPMLARSPSTLHDMAVRLFVNSVASNVNAQSSLANPLVSVPPPSSPIPSSSASAVSSTAAIHHLTPSSSEPTLAANTATSTPVIVDVDNESSNDDS